MIAAIPGNYGDLPPIVWILFTAIVVLVAFGGAYLIVRGITQGKEIERWIDVNEGSEPDIWKGFGPAEKIYEKYPVTESKPLSVIDWISRQQ